MMSRLFRIILMVFRNKIFLYIGTRYVTYALQFVTSIYIALKLGPSGFGVWSFILLIINLYNIVDFGIPNSINILLVQDKDNETRISSHILSSVIITTGLNILIILSFVVIKYAGLEIFAKYDIESYLPAILFIVTVCNLNKIFSSIYRVKNRLFELAFFQSCVPVLLFIIILFSSTNILPWLLGAYIIGQSLSLILFLFRGQIAFKGIVSYQSISIVLNKGVWLFLYNGVFYLIMFSTSSIMSKYYSVADYGKFSFAYTLAHAILLFLEAFSYIVFPKIIHKLKGNNFEECKVVIQIVRDNYLVIVHGLVYLAFPAFYLLCIIMSKYGDVQRMLCIAALTLLPYANAFGLNTFLMAQNEEKKISLASFISLMFNLVCLFLFIQILHFPYDLVLLSTLISYILFTFLCTLFTFKKLNIKLKVVKILKIAFPVRMSIPYFIGLIVAFFFSRDGHFILLLLPLGVFLFLNRKALENTSTILRQLIKKPELVDLK